MEDIAKFQALIGTVETGLRGDWMGGALWVSSPHRYCRNGRNSSTDTGGNSFQALIGTVETLEGRLTVEVSPVFQALIGTVETLHVHESTVWRWLVSSPHRYCRNGTQYAYPSWVTASFKPS